jgi:hypothetical protein
MDDVISAPSKASRKGEDLRELRRNDLATEKKQRCDQLARAEREIERDVNL